MKIAFLTEMEFEGKIPSNFPNMRTEFAWMYNFDAQHYNLGDLDKVRNYDKIFIIFPKGRVFLSPEGSKLIDEPNPVTKLLQVQIVNILKEQGNLEVNYIQEGPHWWFTNYEIFDQINFYNFVNSCDNIYVHNTSDLKYYKGLFQGKNVKVLPTSMVETLIQDIEPTTEEKVIIGGNFSRWYGGFESYIVALNFKLPIWTQTSHSTRQYEDKIEGLYHLPRLTWVDWMKQLSTFKYAVHLMPTVAAGTFSLNCAYFGIPCIGNKEVDTQRLCHPELAVDVSDIEQAQYLAKRLKKDELFYQNCSKMSKENYNRFYNSIKNTEGVSV